MTETDRQARVHLVARAEGLLKVLDSEKWMLPTADGRKLIRELLTELAQSDARVSSIQGELEKANRELGQAGRLIEAMDADLDTLRAERDAAIEEFQAARDTSYLERAEGAEAELDALKAEVSRLREERDTLLETIEMMKNER